MEYCNFIGPSELPCTYTDRDDCLRLCAGSKVVLLSSNFSNFVSVAISRGYDCKIVVDSCVISNCLRAFGFIFNSHGLVKNCLLSSGAVALVANNVKGEILFRNNRLTFGTAGFSKDDKSKLPRHDFANAYTVLAENITYKKPDRAEQSAATKRMHADLLAAAARGGSVLDLGHLIGKSCSRCATVQAPDDEKMKYCVRCKRACYCSKECHNADWGDHKLECRSE